MPIILFTIATAVTFLLGDMIVIPLVMRPMFKLALGTQMLDTLRLGPAALFYLIQICGLVWFAGLPFLRDGKSKLAGLNGALLGLIAYSCYDMTSWTIMRDWHIGLVVVDVAWGTLISGASALVGALAVQLWRDKGIRR